MAVGWFVFPYARKPSTEQISRYCTVYDHLTLIATRTNPQGRTEPAVREIEILGDRALCKARGLPGDLTTLAGFALVRWPNVTPAQMDDPLNTYLNPAQRNRIKNSMLDAGYPQAEIDARWNNFNQATYRECLRFMSQRRLKPRYDTGTDTIVLDGEIQPTVDVEMVDLDISE